MGQIYNTIIEAFTETNRHMQRFDNEKYIIMYVKLNHSSYRCIVGEQGSRCNVAIFYTYYPIDVPKNKRSSVERFITLANSNLLTGNFEFNATLGQVRFKTSASIIDRPATVEELRELEMQNFWSSDAYFPGYLSLLYGKKTPEEAIAMTEDSEDSDSSDVNGTNEVLNPKAVEPGQD